LNTAYFIAKRYFDAKLQTAMVARPAIRVASTAIAISIVVMILTLCIVTGFQKKVSEKITQFAAHIQINRLEVNDSFEKKPIYPGNALAAISKIPNIKHVHTFSTKSGIIKGKKVIQGIVAKGIDKDFNAIDFASKLQAGRLIALNDSSASNEIVISKKMAFTLEVGIDSSLVIYFVQQPPRGRKFKITGLFSTGIAEMDDSFVIIDQKHIRKLNDWDSTEVSGIEVFLHNFEKLDQTRAEINEKIDFDLSATTVKEIFPNIFDWLNVQYVNELIIMILMLLIACINIITILLILILEKNQMIGILKSLGGKGKLIMQIFIYLSFRVMAKGIVLGNIIGLALAYGQQQFKWIKLSETEYYVDAVPIEFSFSGIIFINLITCILAFFTLLIPSFLINKMQPAKILRFD
jgi:lipoprotein-releasing system permease protein